MIGFRLIFITMEVPAGSEIELVQVPLHELSSLQITILDQFR